MRLLKLTIRNFRGFGNTVTTILLDGDLLLFFGPNGFGKTSLAEAIEWLFYGTTKRRQQGDMYSLSEYANTFANVHGGSPTEVTATIRFGEREIVLSRRLTQGENSETLIDGAVAPFSSIPVAPIEAVYPVVAQHGLQTFVHSKPKDRRDAICAALGLDELTALKNTLDSSRASFQRTPPRAVTEARKELAANAQVLLKLPETKDLAKRWAASPLAINMPADYDALLAASEALTGQEGADSQTALTNLREKRQAASRSVFDAGKLVPGEGAIDSITSELKRVRDELNAVERAIAAVVAAMASSYSTAFLELWQKGLELSPSGDECPMCEEETLTADKRAALAKRLSDNSHRLAKSADLTVAMGSAKSRIQRAKGQMAEFGVEVLEAKEIDQLKRLFAGQEQPLEKFLAQSETFNAARTTAKETLDAANTFLDTCAAQLDDADNAPRVVAESARIKDSVHSVVGSIGEVYGSYAEVWRAFEPNLAALISSDEFIARIDGVGKSLKAEPQMRLLDRYDSILNETQELIRMVESEMQRRQEALLTTRGAEVKDLYDRLNRGANVAFDQMEPGTDSMKLHATSFGTRMSAAANLSECQLNCLPCHVADACDDGIIAVWLRAAGRSGPVHGRRSH
jgi:DNA repair exonuclease SbcCD ATPase subunit